MWWVLVFHVRWTWEDKIQIKIHRQTMFGEFTLDNLQSTIQIDNLITWNSATWIRLESHQFLLPRREIILVQCCNIQNTHETSPAPGSIGNLQSGRNNVEFLLRSDSFFYIVNSEWTFNVGRKATSNSTIDCSDWQPLQRLIRLWAIGLIKNW